MFLLAKLRQKYQQQQKKSAWSIGQLLCSRIRDAMLHLTFLICLFNVDTESIFRKYFEDSQISLDNFMSYDGLSSVMQGSKSGLEKRIRSTVTNHILNIDGDCVHHVHDSGKQLCKSFNNFVSHLTLSGQQICVNILRYHQGIFHIGGSLLMTYQ